MDQKDGVKKPGIVVPIVLVVIGVVLIVGSLVWWLHDEKSDDIVEVTNYQSCKDAGGRIAESYPEQCFIDDKSFVNPDHVASDEDEYIGLTEEEAMNKAGQENRPARVVERDGDMIPITMDLVHGRLNFSIENGSVYKVHTESME